MKSKVLVKKLKLRNFKGIKKFEASFNAEITNIFGDNATGKTTLADAFYWLLFNKDTLGQTDFHIKTLDKDGNTIHNLEHSVEGTFMVNNELLTLRKVYKEKWTQKRGSHDKELTGHTTDYFINDVPVQKKDYDKTVADLIPENIFKIITDPFYFNYKMDWQERRRMLFELIEEVSEEDILNSKPKYQSLLDEGKSIDDLQKILKNRNKLLNDEIKEIPIRIDELQRQIVETAPEEKVLADIERLEKELKDVDITPDKALLEKLNDLKGKEHEEYKKYLEKEEEAQKKYYEKREKLVSQRNEYAAKVDDINLQIMRKKLDVESIEKTIENLRKKWQSVNEEQPDFDIDEVCPTCQRPFPPEQITHEKEKLIENFNLNKAQRLETITREGKEKKEEKEKLEKEIAELIESRKSYEQLLEQAEEKLKDYPHHFNYPAFKSPYEQEIKEIEAKIEQGNTNEERERIEKALEDAKAELDQIKRNKEVENRIAELQERHKELLAELSKNEKLLFLIEDFIKEKVTLIEEEVNKKFELVKFQLFKQLINGGIEEICEVTVDGVPYKSMNDAARINAGLDVINVFCRHYGVYAPIWIDKAGEVTKILPTKSQQIRLYVKDGSKLTIK